MLCCVVTATLKSSPKNQSSNIKTSRSILKNAASRLRDAEINLSPKEFRILELFMSHPRRVWSREQLIERVWGPDFMGDSKTVDVHIRWLREKARKPIRATPNI